MPSRQTLSEAIELARAHLHARRWDLCEQVCEAILRVEPGQAEALGWAGAAALQQGDRQRALDHFRRAAEALPQNALAQNSLGVGWEAVGNLEAALAAYRRAIELDPRLASAHYNAANILRLTGRSDQSEAHYRRALDLTPNFPAALLSLATLLGEQDRPDEARELLERGLALQPDWPLVLNNLGIVYRDLGRAAEAEECLRKAISRDPGMVEAHSNLGLLLKDQMRDPEALACFAEALRLKPDLADALQGLAGLYRQHAKAEKAAECYRRLLRVRPKGLARLELATLLPVIYQSVDQINAVRAGLMAELARLAAEGFRLDFCRQTPHTLFHLAYQGLNDRPVHKLMAQLSAAGPPAELRRPAKGSRLRVGFVSSLLRDHTIGHLWQEMIAGLSRERFEVFVYSTAAEDPVARRIRGRADHWTALPPRAAIARQTIAAAGLDVLVFPEVGMEPVVWALATSRLARVQCAGWGHPVTTGLPTIDYFLSSRLMEPAEAEEHYTERLVQMEGFGLAIRRPEIPPPARRSEFGLPEERRLYGCLQSLFKIHPDDDVLLAEILRRDPQGELILLEGTEPQWRGEVLQRFSTSMPDVVGRVRFLRRQTSEDFLRLSGLMDVMLDPLHFSGGRTSYEAFALGVPVVALPSGLLRGRITLGIYRAMGVSDCLAADKAHYVDLALRLAREPDFRHAVREKILAGADRFFADRTALGQFEDFLDHAAAG